MKYPRKEVYKNYRGVCILKDSSYTDNDLFNNSKDLRSLRVMLMTPDVERYFNTIGQARAYVDKHFEEIQKENNKWFEVPGINYDDIPF